ncbi:MAG: hypothetical protein A3J97_09210 [Spirochaetes bacterium RIFOXYC1_FULL_54_7]|nr:MAG: hypothetical protein A3J97_09210 [Spirochaetes bacterium RIFOXYC1_FULL_54_7]
MLGTGGQQACNLAVDTEIATPGLKSGSIQSYRPIGTGSLAQSTGGAGIRAEDNHTSPITGQGPGKAGVDTGWIVTLLAGHRHKVANGR